MKSMSFKTDSVPLEDPKEPDSCSVFALYKLFADDEQQNALADRYRAGDSLNVTREVDRGMEIVKLNLPAVINTHLRLNEPRFASLPNIMKAKKKPMETVTPEELGVDVTPHVTVLEVVEPAKREAGIRVESVQELVEKLRSEAKVI